MAIIEELELSGDAGETTGCREALATLDFSMDAQKRFLEVLESMFRDLPTSEAAIGESASYAMTRLRGKIVESFLMYKSHHLPEVLDFVAKVKDCLRKHFIIPFADFMTVKEVLNRRLGNLPIKGRELADQYGEYFPAKHTVTEINSVLASVLLQMDEPPKSSNNQVKSDMTGRMRVAHATRYLTPKFPSSRAEACASEPRANGHQLRVVCDNLQKVSDEIRAINNLALHTYTVSLRELAKFLSNIGQKLGSLAPAGLCAGHAESAFRLMHDRMQDDALVIVEKLGVFESSCNDIKIAIEVLNQYQQDNQESCLSTCG